MDDLFLNPARLGALIGDLLPRIKAAKPDDGASADASNGKTPGFAPMDYENIGGVAVIPIRGGLVSAQIPGWRSYAATTYESIVATLEKAVADPTISKILLSINSPGGSVTGCAEAAAQIDALSEKKPISCYCAMADSAAYWLAAATNKIIVDPTGEVGSIGVIMTHIDVSKALEDFGVKVTHIFSGARKADGTPYQPLSGDAEAKFKADMDHLRGVFVGSVAALRNMDADQVSQTEAMTYKGKQAVDAGLADDTGFFTEVLNQMAGRTGSSIVLKQANKKEISMAKTEPTKPATEEGKPAAPAAEKPEGEKVAPVAKTDPAPAAQPSAVDQKARIKAITGHAEAQGRKELAEHLAFDTDMSAEDAVKMLAKAPKTVAEKPENPLAAAMRTQGSPKIGAGDGGPKAENTLVADMERRFVKK
jgi:signal peptide peptidase SppA